MRLVTRVIQGLLCLIPIGVLAYIGVANVVPTGVFHIPFRVGVSSAFVDGLVPRERVSDVFFDDDGTRVQKLTGDPVFFFLRPHRSFDAAEATITFKNEGAPMVEFGALTAVNPDRHTLFPIDNTLIDESSWSRLTTADGYVLLQRRATYDSVQAFLDNPPPRDQVVTYQANLSVPFRLPGYVASTAQQTIPVSLRGSVAMKVYAKQEPIRLTWTYTDMNRAEGTDPVVVVITDEQGRMITSMRADDDGVTQATMRGSALRTMTVETPVLPEGVYKIEWQTNRDIFVRRLETTLQKIVFLNGVYLGDESGYKDRFAPVTFWTEAKRVSAQTRHAESAQAITMGSAVLKLTAPYELVTQSIADPGLVAVSVTKGDVEFLTDGPVAFSREQYFRPDPVRLWPHTNLDALGINYLYAKYTPPTVGENGWKTATVRLEGPQLLLNQGAWKWVFSLPEIEDVHGAVLVKSIDFTLHRPPLETFFH